jgi:hypothetical protein
MVIRLTDALNIGDGGTPNDKQFEAWKPQTHPIGSPNPPDANPFEEVLFRLSELDGKLDTLHRLVTELDVDGKLETHLAKHESDFNYICEHISRELKHVQRPTTHTNGFTPKKPVKTKAKRQSRWRREPPTAPKDWRPYSNFKQTKNPRVMYCREDQADPQEVKDIKAKKIAWAWYLAPSEGYEYGSIFYRK